ncbi:hypothetical protein ACEWY4_022740 [Coilia grayii]|uniref:Structural maintenance of chromosomes protein n=1 Tax=Coilia grayii TaxID=363190 RepID=A0ABD1J169_9TELE
MKKKRSFFSSYRLSLNFQSGRVHAPLIMNLHDIPQARKFQGLLDDGSACRLQLSLFQLYHNERGSQAVSESLRERQEAVAAQRNVLDTWEETVKNQKKEHGRLSRELQQVEKKIRGEEQKLTTQRSQYTKARVNTSHHENKAKEGRAGLRKGQRQREEKEGQLEGLRTQLQELERAWKSYERQAKKEETTRGRDLKRYEELKEVYRKQAAMLEQQLEKLQWEVKADGEKLEFDRRRKLEVEANVKSCQAQLDDYRKRADKLEEYITSCTRSVEELRVQEESLCEALEGRRVRSLEVNAELGQVLGELQNAHVDHQENRRRQKRQDVLDSLRRFYPEALFGRLVDLCQPIHKKYQLAVAKVFGRYMNAIVVTTEKVARECIKFVKQERAEPETFLPIDYLDVGRVNERLREQQGCKLLVDVVQTAGGAPELRRVLQFVCGNTLVCDTIEEARSLAFGPERLKTVALDGTLFSKSGVISGGAAHLRSKVRRWEERDLSKLKERKDQLVAELEALRKLGRKEAELKDVRAQAQGSETRLKYTHTELDALRKKTIPGRQAVSAALSCCYATAHYAATASSYWLQHVEISRLESVLSNLESQICVSEESVEKKERELRELKEKTNQVLQLTLILMEDAVFADFCHEIGVANIREYEQEYVKQQQEVDRKRLQFESQRTRVIGQLEYEEEQLKQLSRKLDKLQDTIDKEEDTIQNLKKEEEKLLALVDETEACVQELKDVHANKKSDVSTAKADLDQKAKDLQQVSRDLVRLQKEVLSVEAALDQKRLARHNLLIDCKVQGIPILLLSGAIDDISDVQLDSETQSTFTTGIYEREEQMQIDYSALPRDLKVSTTQPCPRPQGQYHTTLSRDLKVSTTQPFLTTSRSVPHNSALQPQGQYHRTLPRDLKVSTTQPCLRPQGQYHTTPPRDLKVSTTQPCPRPQRQYHTALPKTSRSVLHNPAQGLKALGEEQVERELQALRERLSSLETVILRSEPPNLKALDKMREIKDSLRTVMDTFDESTSIARHRCHEFEQVKVKRFRLFSQCFEQVCVSVDQIYKRMCRNNSAQAILSAENPDEPYLDGISFNCVAPGKRYMAMDNLSGGEKAIAALALIFALHSFRPAPFFVLDEVDAALDNTNIGKARPTHSHLPACTPVTGFIRDQCQEDFQVIVISLKEEFYSRADVLLGVYSEPGENTCSRVLSLDLTPYPLTEDNSSQKDPEM